MENANVREHNPPMVRAATSITVARPSWTRTSAWTGPWRSPMADVAAEVTCGHGRHVGRVRRDGVT